MSPTSPRLLSIGEFAAATQLSAKALRLYDEQNLLSPARVDASTGYRYYRSDQVARGRLVRTLRETGLTLAQIASVVDASPAVARTLLISLVGPPNRLLEAVTRKMLARGHALVAAVGNDGPAAKPLFPASYAGVLGVTAVDAKSRVLLEACRGEQVDFAAPGSGIAAASLQGSFDEVRGTSFAAPIVAALLAARLASLDRQAAHGAMRELESQATDLGRKGRDDTYGSGLVGQSLRPQLAAALANKSNGHK